MLKFKFLLILMYAKIAILFRAFSICYHKLTRVNVESILVTINKHRQMRKPYGGVLCNYCVNWEDCQIRFQRRMSSCFAGMPLTFM